MTDIPVAHCRASPAAREVKPIHVEMLVRSIQQVGLIQPIVVRCVGAGYEVIAGMHRLSAFQHLGRERIPAIIRTDDDLHAELALIDENLIRNELSPAERALAIARRKAIYEALHPATAHGGDRKSSRQLGDLIEPDRKPDDADRFTKSTAEVTGRSERAVQRDAQRGETLGDDALRAVTGTSLDTGEELDALAKLQPEHRARLIEKAAAGEDVSAKRGDAALPNGARSIMPNRIEPDDSLDFFPTPPWATRALIELVLPQIGVRRIATAWEPACGEGHIAEVLREYCPAVTASDIHDYGYGLVNDFLGDPVRYFKEPVDWIITNPPFDQRAEQFVMRALQLARVGVAMFFRWQWLETIGRYERLFSPHAPTLVCPFAERVPLHKGRWEPNGVTATAYCWIVWRLNREAPQTRLFWIPPGCRKQLSKPDDDVERFTAHPVIIRYHSTKTVEEVTPAIPAPPSQRGSPNQPNDELLDIPPFLDRRPAMTDDRETGSLRSREFKTESESDSVPGPVVSPRESQMTDAGRGD